MSRQDRLGATISNSVDPEHPRFVLLQTHVAFSESIAAVSGSRAGLLIQTSLGKAGGLGRSTAWCGGYDYSLGLLAGSLRLARPPTIARADFWLWLFRYRRESRPILLEAISTHAAQADLHMLRNPAALRRFLAHAARTS